MASGHMFGENQYLSFRANNEQVFSYRPQVRVSFHTEAACYVAKGRVIPWGQTELDPTFQIISVTTQKQLGSPAGAFTIQLSGSQWVNRLKPNDLAVIKMGYEGEKTATAMVGLIDTVTQRRSMSENQPQITTTITGRDFGKLFLKSVLRFYPEIGLGQKDAGKFFLTEEGWINMVSIFTQDSITKGTPAVILDNIMRFIMMKLNETQWNVYDEAGTTPKKKTVSFGNIVRYQFQKMDFFLPFMLTADQFEGSVWNLMERAVQKPFTELFVDVRDADEIGSAVTSRSLIPGTLEQTSSPEKSNLPKDRGYYPSPAVEFGEDRCKVVLAYREAPFDSANWKKLTKHKLTTVDVLSDEVSRSDNEHYNLFWAGTTINPLGIDLKRVAPPLMNVADVKRYGISPLEVQIEGLEILSANKDDHAKKLESLSKTYSAKLKAWFEKNHQMWSGSIEARGKASYRVGQVLEYAPADGQMKEYYIEGVSQNFHMYTDWTTSLSVTRGIKTTATIDSTKTTVSSKATSVATNTTATTTTAAPKPKDTYYTVKKGDSLWTIAQKEYKKGSDWTRIWEANKDMLIARDSRNRANPGKYLYPGQLLRIPK